MLTIRSLRPTALLLLTFIILSACGTQSAPPATSTADAPSKEAAASMAKNITVCLPADVTTLDIRVQTTRNLRSIVGNIHDSLIATWGPKLELVPQLATSWEYIDPLTLRLKLRNGVTFTNGEAFNAQAVKYSIESQQGGKGTVRTYLSEIKEVRVVDDYTVDLITHKPSAILVRNLTAALIYPPKYGQEMGDKFSENPIGTGPFKFVEWVRGDHVTLEANREYWNTSLWDGPPPVDQVMFKVCSEVSTRLAMLQQQEADLIDNILPEMVPQIDNQTNTRTVSFPGYKRIFLHIDARAGSAPPLDDVRVRQALNYAIDRDLIIKSLLSGYAKPYTGFVHPGFLSQHKDVQPYRYDPDLAKKLLAEAGVTNGFEVNLYTPVGTYLKDKEVCEAIQAQLDMIGVKVNLVPMEFADYISKLINRELKGLSLDRRLVNTGDPVDGYLYMLYSKGGVPYISDPVFDKMLEEANTTADATKRIELISNTIEPYVWNKMVSEVALYDITDIYGLSSEIVWHPVNLQEQIDLRGLGHTDWPTP